MTEITDFIIYAVAGYFLGAVPFGLILGFLGGYGDIRKIGSGNIGATNMLRTGNKALALATLVLDAAKGGIAVLLARYLTDDFNIAMTAGLFAIAGHMFPLWLKFKGGKGVATTLGTLLALTPPLGALACATWLLVAALSRYSSLAALIAVLSTPFAAYLLYEDDNLMGVCGVIALMVWVRHRPNIHRIVRGEEPKIGRKKQNEDQQT